MALPDLVYSVKPVGDCDELRHSLRSIDAYADGLFRKVWVIGQGLPDWLTNVEIIDSGTPLPDVKKDVRHKITLAVNHRSVASEIVLMHDDFFLVEPIDRWESFHMGPTSEFLKRIAGDGSSRGWRMAVLQTAEWMAEQGHGDILARQGHRPLRFSKSKLRKVLDEYPQDRRLDVAGLYDIAGLGGVGRRAVNAKVRDSAEHFYAKLAELDMPWLSSSDGAFARGMIGGYIRGMFRQPSRFEVVNDGRPDLEAD